MQMVAQGYDADHFVAFFKEMAAKSCSGGDCAEGKCADGKCSEGKCSEGKCTGDKSAADKSGAASADAAAPTAEKKSSCGGCKGKDEAKTDAAPAKPAETPMKP